jgi:hypothetical protein
MITTALPDLMLYLVGNAKYGTARDSLPTWGKDLQAEKHVTTWY